ncbi:MAG: hypothetical protein N4A54_03110 [Peptostreptococcaceae bacterium]|jgi:hypothetical protein|nr:hypothetical protein [Peptostreptococcaceae bacterium]
MSVGKFYFLKDEYFNTYVDKNLMGNKESKGKELNDRPCFYSFKDKRTGLIWLIPISSKVDKFKSIYEYKVKKNRRCDTIVFGEVLGRKKAFLIQNMCPCTPKYLKSIYVDSRNNDTPVQVSDDTKKELIKKAKKVLTLHRQGRKLIFPDVINIEKELIKEINEI